MTTELDLGFTTRRRVRLARQTELAECGLACIAMIAGYHDLGVDLASLRRRFSVSERGASLKSLTRVADSIGLSARAVRLPLSSLGGLALPAVLHWDMNHFVVIEAVKGGRVLIHDPAGRSGWQRLSEVSTHFTGVALELAPMAGFATGERPVRLRLRQLWGRITGLKRTLVQVFVLSVVLQILALASPYYMQIAIDTVLPAADRDLLNVLAIGFGLLALIGLATSTMRSFVLLWAGNSAGFAISSNLSRRLLRLPLDWFSRRQTGDVLSRFGSVAPVQSLLTTGAVGALLDGLTSVLTFGLMFMYSPALTALALAAFAAYVLIRLISFPLQRAAQEDVIVASAKQNSLMIETLRGMTTVRLSNKEGQRQDLIQLSMVDALNAGVVGTRLGIWQSAANGLVTGLEGVVSVWLAISFVLQGGFSVGMVFAFMAYKQQFLSRGTSLVDQVIGFRMLGLHLERLSDIVLSEEDASFAHSPVSPRELRGRIELRDVSYRYADAEPFVLAGASLLVEPGEHVAITGPSGGGKSTLLRILLGLSQPSGGEVLIDDVPLARFGVRNYHQQVAGVLQDDVLFAGSLAENIALFDDSLDMGLVERAAIAAAVHDDIRAMPMGYETLVGDMGSSLSGGQRQRVLLARALYRQPKVLVIDEGTSHLDPMRERSVNAAISALGITRIVVAHRAETVMAADRVVVMDEGTLSEPVTVPASNGLETER